ncbi:hypothetical protein LAZ67_X004825 [Cordylochernes scorpioides]|uniref:Uncharacterized protein n=1 Tax=Cordylochernes scorpioides TaxID=51811 RepID=A0ABY6LVR6_9ARAC|nr:hypothetical protein LAZ67_X004825 [Cordylochernes scorpioides]
MLHMTGTEQEGQAPVLSSQENNRSLEIMVSYNMTHMLDCCDEARLSETEASKHTEVGAGVASGTPAKSNDNVCHQDVSCKVSGLWFAFHSEPSPGSSAVIETTSLPNVFSRFAESTDQCQIGKKKPKSRGFEKRKLQEQENGRPSKKEVKTVHTICELEGGVTNEEEAHLTRSKVMLPVVDSCCWMMLSVCYMLCSPQCTKSEKLPVKIPPPESLLNISMRSSAMIPDETRLSGSTEEIQLGITGLGASWNCNKTGWSKHTEECSTARPQQGVNTDWDGKRTIVGTWCNKQGVMLIQELVLRTADKPQVIETLKSLKLLLKTGEEESIDHSSHLRDVSSLRENVPVEISDSEHEWVAFPPPGGVGLDFLSGLVAGCVFFEEVQISLAVGTSLSVGGRFGVCGCEVGYRASAKDLVTFSLISGSNGHRVLM